MIYKVMRFNHRSNILKNKQGSSFSEYAPVMLYNYKVKFQQRCCDNSDDIVLALAQVCVLIWLLYFNKECEHLLLLVNFDTKISIQATRSI